MNKVLVFALGAVAGSLVTWKLVEEKYKAIANDEIASVVEQFKKREETKSKVLKVEELDELVEEPRFELVEEQIDEFTDEEKEEYTHKVEDLGYSNQPLPREYVKPYVIAPDEFGEFGNGTRCLTYYSDFTLVDDDDQIISNPEDIIGDALEHFGEYEEDSVHVRNESLECDFEILKSEKTFSEVYKGDD